MATVDLTDADASVEAGNHPGKDRTNQPYVVEVIVTGAGAVDTKGSALASADVLQVMDIPAETMVLSGGIEVTTADTGTTLTMDFGYGSNVDVFTDGGDATATGYLALGTNGKAITSAARFTSADTLDIVLASLSGANDDWVVRCYAVMLDISGKPVADSA